MSILLRYFALGQTCFVTSVVADRRQLLVDSADLLARAVHRAHRKSLFTVVAWVVLPDHFHALLYTPNGDTSSILQRVKQSFSRQHRSMTGVGGSVWQHRYWDHIVRSEEDMRHHIDYIHYNPVKHGLVKAPKDWPFSTFWKFVNEGIYDESWACDVEISRKIEGG